MRTPLLALGWVLSLTACFGLGWYLAPWADPRWDAVRALEMGPRLAADEDAGRAPIAGSQPALGDSVRAALRQPDRLDRFRGLVQALESLGPENLPGVLEAYEEEEAGIGECELRPFVYTWARFDPEGALARMGGWESRIKRRMGIAAVVYAWALRDPLAARQAVEDFRGDALLHERLQMALVNGWVHSDVPGLMEHLASLPQGKSRGALTAMAVTVIRWSSGTEAMLRLVSALPDDAENGFKRTAFRKAAQLTAKRDPERAAQWVEAQPKREWAEDGIRIVAEHWCPVDPGVAFDWLRAKPSGNARDQAVRAGYSRWLKRDRAAAAAWLDSESLTEFHDPALDVLAREIASRSPEKAIGWARRIGDAGLRVESLTAVGKRWFRADPQAARAWLAESELPEKARRAVLETPPRTRRRPFVEGGHEPSAIEFERLEKVDPS